MSEQLRDPLGGELRVGIIPTIAPYLLPHILKPVHEALPNLEMHLTEGQTAQLVRKLKQGELDAILLALPLDEENIAEYALYDEPFFFAVAHSHPKAGKTQVTTADLDNEEVLLLEDGHCLRDQALEVCHTHRGVESKNYSATSLETLRQLVAAGLGITLMPELAVNDVKSGNGSDISYIPFVGDVPSRTLGLCWRTSSTRIDLLQELAGVIHRCMH